VVYRLIRKVLARLLDRSRFVDKGLESLLMKTFSMVGWVFIGIMVLAQFGINVTALLAGLSVIGIAVGFAAQDTLQNFISGITVMMDRPFRVGDYIEIEETYGRVEEITLRSTRMRTLNNEIMVMPNNQMINQKLINHAKLGLLRVVVPFGIAYKEYPQEARKIVLGLTEGDDRLHPDRTPDVVVTELNNSSVDMQLRVFVRDASLAVPIRCEYTEKIREALREADIEIPFPHLQLFVDEAKGLQDLSFPFTEENRAGGAKPMA
jgi:small conductance mechanosensitive channel